VTLDVSPVDPQDIVSRRYVVFGYAIIRYLYGPAGRRSQLRGRRVLLVPRANQTASGGGSRFDSVMPARASGKSFCGDGRRRRGPLPSAAPQPCGSRLERKLLRVPQGQGKPIEVDLKKGGLTPNRVDAQGRGSIKTVTARTASAYVEARSSDPSPSLAPTSPPVNDR